MKISKLFHWLYACLMLLPVFAIGVTCAYAVFNKNAKDSYSGSESFTYYEKVEYQTNEVNSVDDLVVGNVYKFFYLNDVGDNWSSDNPYDYFDTYTPLLSVNSYGYVIFIDEIIGTHFIANGYNWRFAVEGSYNNFYIYYFYDDQNYVTYVLNTFDERENYYFQFLMTEDFYNFIIDTDFVTFGFISVADLSECVPTYIEKTTEVSTLDNVFYDSVKEVGENPYFAWANDSFLAQPVQYITTMFGMPSDSSIITLLSYWLAISIIYLCFDVIMYVPLLAHRWLDKGMLE